MTTEPLQDPTFRRLLAALDARRPIDAWLITRRQGPDLRVVATHGDGLGIRPGASVSWDAAVCGAMARGEGPRAAPVLDDVPAYANKPMARELGLGAYVGVPIPAGDRPVGSICGLAGEPQDESLEEMVPILEASAGLVGRLWTAEREARTDPLTGLPNRRAWEEEIAREEERCRRFGHAAAVLATDLDDFKSVNDRLGYAGGDAYLRRAASAISESVRDHDLVARWGGDEFCVLAVECDEASARALAGRVREALRESEVSASVGVAPRGPEGLAGTVGRALATLAGAKREAPGGA